MIDTEIAATCERCGVEITESNDAFVSRRGADPNVDRAVGVRPIRDDVHPAGGAQIMEPYVTDLDPDGEISEARDAVYVQLDEWDIDPLQAADVQALLRGLIGYQFWTFELIAELKRIYAAEPTHRTSIQRVLAWSPEVEI